MFIDEKKFKECQNAPLKTQLQLQIGGQFKKVSPGESLPPKGFKDIDLQSAYLLFPTVAQEMIRYILQEDRNQNCITWAVNHLEYEAKITLDRKSLIPWYTPRQFTAKDNTCIIL